LFYVTENDLAKFFFDIKSNLFINAPEFSFNRLMIVALVYLGLLLIISLGFLFSKINSKKIKSRKTFSLLLWGLVISLALYFILPSVSVEIIWIAGIPASYFLVHYFIFSRKKLVPEIIFIGFFLMIILVQVIYIF
jgi:hypothetical protein